MTPAKKTSSRRGLLWMILADKCFLEIVYFKITFPTNHETLGCYMVGFFLFFFSLKTYYIVNGVSKSDRELIKI